MTAAAARIAPGCALAQEYISAWGLGLGPVILALVVSP